jgi:hypothetical protein
LRADLLFVFAIAGCACVSTAASAQSTAQQDDLPPSMRRVWGIVLNRDSLASTFRKLGRTQTWRTGDAGEARVWWCYEAAGSSSASVIISSDGEMGGAHHDVDQIDVMRAPYHEAQHRCRTVRTGQAPETVGGLRLGLSRTAVMRLLNRPAGTDADSMWYRWDTERTLTPRDRNYRYWTRRAECFGGRAPFTEVGASIVVRFTHDRVGSYTISRGESIC